MGGLRHRPQPVTPAPQQISIPATAAVWGPGKPLPLCRGHRGQRPGRSGSKAEAGFEQAPGDGDLMMQNLMTRSLWGGGASLGGRGGGGQSSSQLSAPGSPAKAGAASPQGPGLSLALREVEGHSLPACSPWDLNWEPGPVPQHLCDLPLLICYMGQGSMSEGSCEAWQEPIVSRQ